ncbi:MAG: FUSC family protein [Candidatus Sulfotelmatobacter sp.]
MPLSKLQTLSAWDLVYAVDGALAAVVTYGLMAFIVPWIVNKPPTSVGILWAVISAVFVFKDTRAHSLSAGISRLIATCVSFGLCLSYLLLFPANPLAMILLIAASTLVMMLVGRRDEIGLTAISTAVVLIVAASEPHDAWQQPLLRLMDTVAGVAVGIALKWIASSLFFRVMGEDVR